MNKPISLEQACADRQALWVSLAAVLHDLRNPLHNATLLMEALPCDSEETARVRAQVLEQLGRIHTRIRRVMAQLSDFAGESACSPVVLAKVVDEVLSFVEPQAREVDVNISVECPAQLTVMADAGLLTQALEHLILNCLEILAVQPPEKQRQLWISAHTEGSTVWLSLQDSGPGLPEEVARAPFTPLMGPQARGMGLGLAIAHALAQAGGGELMLYCTNERGTHFRIGLEGIL